MKDSLLKDFHKKYENIQQLIYNNVELTKEQQEHIIKDLEKVLEDIKFGNAYRSTYHLLQMLLKDIQFYEYINHAEIRLEEK